jgi:hypothetical protein
VCTKGVTGGAWLRNAVKVKGILKHEQEFQKFADANNGTRASGTPGSPSDREGAAMMPLPFSFQLAQQTFHVERTGDHRERPAWGAWPLVLRAVAVKLDAVSVGVAQVEGLGYAMV